MDEWIIPVIVALIPASIGLWTLFARRDNRSANTASILTGAAMQMVSELQDQVDALRQRQHEQSVLILSLQDRIRHLEDENRKLRKENEHLREQFEIATGTKPDTGPLRGDI